MVLVGDKSMDWKKAKTILISVFFILNIVLAFTLYNELKVDEIPQQTIINTSKILGQNNIHIECPIPKYSGNDYTLKYEENVLDEKKIADVLLGDNWIKEASNLYKKGSMSIVFYDEYGFDFFDMGDGFPIKGDIKNSLDNFLRDTFDKIGLPFNEFKQDGYYPNVENDAKGQVMYKGQYKDYPVFDNYINIEINNSKIKSIKYYYKKPISIVIKKDVYVIPSYEILITEMTKYKYPGISIAQVDIGFKGYTRSDKKTITSFEGLAWRIKTYNGQEYYFNARNGTLIG